MVESLEPPTQPAPGRRLMTLAAGTRLGPYEIAGPSALVEDRLSNTFGAAGRGAFASSRGKC